MLITEHKAQKSVILCESVEYLDILSNIFGVFCEELHETNDTTLMSEHFHIKHAVN